MSLLRRLWGRFSSKGGPGIRQRVPVHKSASAWQKKWSDPNYNQPWMNRGVSPEIIESVREGWFHAGANFLDIGCGAGEVAAWMSENGFPSVGVDIAEAAVQRARSKYPEIRGRLEFFAVDMCAAPPPDRCYRNLIDRGCFHTIHPPLQDRFLDNILAVSAPDARLLLFVRAYRDGVAMGDAAERERHDLEVQAGFERGFRIVRSCDTFLDAYGGKNPEKAMGGIVYWMERR